MGSKLPVLCLDVAGVIEAWNTRATVQEVLKGQELSAQQANPAKVRICNDENCGWSGVTDRTCGSIGPLCERCGETTEEAQQAKPKEYTMGNWFNDLDNPHANR